MAPIHNQALLYDRQTDITIGQRVVSDRSLACAVFMRLKTLSNVEVKVCLAL